MTGQNISHRFRFAMSEWVGLQIEIPFGTRSPTLLADIQQEWKTDAPTGSMATDVGVLQS